MVVSTDKPVSGEGDALPRIPKAEGLPVGNYRLVGWDLDLTGRRLVDEIVQIAAFTPEKNFSLYVMPRRDLNLAARRRHRLKVVTIRRYRVLKNLQTNKVIKTKSEISGLVDFISWLEEVKGDAKDGIILVCHEGVHSCPLLLLHSLGRYPHANLVERFKNVVAGFANGFAIAERKCAKTVNQFNLRTLSTVLLSKEEEMESAAERARLAYQVMQQVCSAEEGADNNAGAGDSAAPNVAQLVNSVRDFAQPVDREESLLIQQQDMVKRQDALRPVFHSSMRATRKDRERAFILRRHLVNANISMDQITTAWNNGQKEAVNKLLETEASVSDEKDREDLTQMIEWHFVPELRPKIERRPLRPKKIRRSSKTEKTNGSVENGVKEPSTPENGSKEAPTTTESPDTTTASPKKERSPKKRNSETKDSKEAVAC